MKKFIDKYTNQKTLLLILIISVIFFIFGLSIYISKTRITTLPKAAGSQCGNCTGSCNLNGQYCESFKYCEGQNPIIDVYICKDNNIWEFAYPQRGAFCQNILQQCGGTPPQIPQPTGYVTCGGGLYNVFFKANRPLVSGENITCTITGRSNCVPCTGAYKERSCGIGPGISQCGVSGLDCTCAPFNYNCSGSAQASGTFSTVTNAGSSTVNLYLGEIQKPAQPTPVQPTPTKKPTPEFKPTSTPTPIPTATTIPTLTNTPTPTEEIKLTNTPTTSPIPNTPTPTVTNTPIPETPTPTLIASLPTSTPTETPIPETPTPTEIILAKIVDTATPTKEIITTAPTIPSSGKISNILFLIPLSIILLSLFI